MVWRFDLVAGAFILTELRIDFEVAFGSLVIDDEAVLTVPAKVGNPACMEAQLRMMMLARTFAEGVKLTTFCADVTEC